MSWRTRAIACCAIVCLLPGRGAARTGTLAPSVGSFDARASHLSASAVYGSSKGGGALDFWGGTGGFSTSSGIASAEFGIYVLRQRESERDANHRGIAMTAIGLWSLPLGERFRSGVPATAFAFYTGVAPAAVVSGVSSSLTLPLVIGAGFPLSEERFTLTPWFEAAPTLNVDPTVSQQSFTDAALSSGLDPQSGHVTNEQIADTVDQAVRYEETLQLGLRYGVTAELRLTNQIDLRLLAAGTFLHAAFDSPPMLQLGIGVTWRWDDVVRAVLPPDARAAEESCDEVEARFAACPLYQKLITQREEARRRAERRGCDAP